MKTSLTTEMIPDYKIWDLHNQPTDHNSSICFNNENPYGSLNWMNSNDPQFWNNMGNPENTSSISTVLNNYNHQFNPSDIPSLISRFNQLKDYPKCNSIPVQSESVNEDMVYMPSLLQYSSSLRGDPKGLNMANQEYLNGNSQNISQGNINYCNEFVTAPQYNKYQHKNDLCNPLLYEPKRCGRDSNELRNNINSTDVNTIPISYTNSEVQHPSSHGPHPHPQPNSFPLMYFLDSLNLPHVLPSDKHPMKSFNLKNIYVPPECTYKFDAELTLSSNIVDQDGINGKPPNSRGNAEYLCSFPGVSWNTRMQSWLVYYEDLTGRKSKTFNPKRFSVDKLDRNNVHYDKLKNLDPMIIAMHFACAFASEARYKARLFKNYNLPLARACKKFFRKRVKTDTKKNKNLNLNPFHLELNSNVNQQSSQPYVMINNSRNNQDKLYIPSNDQLNMNHTIQTNKDNSNNCNFIDKSPAVLTSKNDNMINNIIQDNYYSQNMMRFKSPPDTNFFNEVYNLDLNFNKIKNPNLEREQQSSTNYESYNNSSECNNFSSPSNVNVHDSIKVFPYPNMIPNSIINSRSTNSVVSDNNLWQVPVSNHHLMTCLCPSKLCQVHNSIEVPITDRNAEDSQLRNPIYFSKDKSSVSSIKSSACVPNVMYTSAHSYYYSDPLYQPLHENLPASNMQNQDN